MSKVTITIEDYDHDYELPPTFTKKQDETYQTGNGWVISEEPKLDEEGFIITGEPQKKFLCKNLITKQKNIANKQIAACKLRMSMNHNGLLKMENWSSTKNSNWCKSKYEITRYYESPDITLSGLIADRSRYFKPFSSKELNSIQSDCLTGLSYLHKSGFWFGDLKPDLIGRNYRQNNKWFLVDRLYDWCPLLFQNNLEYIQNPDGTTDSSIYMSPALFSGYTIKNKQSLKEKAKDKKPNTKHNAQASDAFSLGLIILEAGLLVPVQDIYDRKLGQINPEQLKNHLSDFKGNYKTSNFLLCDAVERLLTLDENNRASCYSLLSTMDL